jgi:hypothetical protein
MVPAYRVCLGCGEANEVRAYDCVACGASLDSTIPRALTKGVQISRECLPEPDGFSRWANDVEAGIAHDEVHCHNCSAQQELLQFPFALANLEAPLNRWLPTVGSLAASSLLAPLGIGFLAWRSRRSGLAFPMNLILCQPCAAELEDFYGQPARDAYRLHPWYETLEGQGYDRFVSEAELGNWKHI